MQQLWIRVAKSESPGRFVRVSAMKNRLLNNLLLILFVYGCALCSGAAPQAEPAGKILRETPPSADMEVSHQTFQIDGANYDAIVTRPKAPGRHPAVLLIPGLGCYSLAGLQPGEPYYELLYGLTRKGFVTMRVQKNGEGASQGPPCDSPASDLKLAVRRSVAGLNALAGYDFVDRDNVFILAHSIGPLEGVFVAQQFPVRGFIAAETIGKTWMEYTLENARRQMTFLGKPYDAVERYVRLTEKCQHRFLIEKQSPEQVIKDAPECKTNVNTFGVSATYLQQIADIDLATEWKKLDVPVLVTWGTSDPTTDAAENRYLVEVINSFHPNRASYVELPGMGHGLDLAATPRAWLDAVRNQQQLEFDREFLERVGTWLDQQRKREVKGS